MKAALIVVLAALALAGCGRKGAPVPPPTADQPAAEIPDTED
ncbi:MAG: lipoprotein [Paracoccaceae bacterium]